MQSANAVGFGSLEPFLRKVLVERQCAKSVAPHVMASANFFSCPHSPSGLRLSPRYFRKTLIGSRAECGQPLKQAARIDPSNVDLVPRNRPSIKTDAAPATFGKPRVASRMPAVGREHQLDRNQLMAGKSRIGDLGGWRSERPQSALPVEICEAQHLSSWVFLRSLRLAPMSALAPTLPSPAKK